MDQVYVLGVILAALLLVYLAYGARRGEQKTQNGISGPEDDTETDTKKPEKKPRNPADGKPEYQKKAMLIQKLLDTVKKTEGLRETTLTEIKYLESRIESVKKNIDKGKSQHSLREADMQMTYLSSRIDWIIKSYPRLRNDKSLLEVQQNIRKINEVIMHQRGEYDYGRHGNCL
jgi:hypothetical protein